MSIWINRLLLLSGDTEERAASQGKCSYGGIICLSGGILASNENKPKEWERERDWGRKTRSFGKGTYVLKHQHDLIGKPFALTDLWARIPSEWKFICWKDIGNWIWVRFPSLFCLISLSLSPLFFYYLNVRRFLSLLLRALSFSGLLALTHSYPKIFIEPKSKSCLAFSLSVLPLLLRLPPPVTKSLLSTQAPLYGINSMYKSYVSDLFLSQEKEHSFDWITLPSCTD